TVLPSQLQRHLGDSGHARRGDGGEEEPALDQLAGEQERQGGDRHQKKEHGAHNREREAGPEPRAKFAGEKGGGLVEIVIGRQRRSRGWRSSSRSGTASTACATNVCVSARTAARNTEPH